MFKKKIRKEVYMTIAKLDSSLRRDFENMCNRIIFEHEIDNIIERINKKQLK